MADLTDYARRRLTELLRGYGARQERWPAEDRLLARRGLGDDATTRAAADEARELDSQLDKAFIPFPNEKLVNALLEIPARHPKAHGWWETTDAPWQKAAAAVLLLVTGLVAGRLVPVSAEMVADNDSYEMTLGSLVLGPELPDMEIR